MSISEELRETCLNERFDVIEYRKRCPELCAKYLKRSLKADLMLLGQCKVETGLEDMKPYESKYVDKSDWKKLLPTPTPVSSVLEDLEEAKKGVSKINKALAMIEKKT